MCTRTRATSLAARSLFFATFFGLNKFAQGQRCFKGASERSELTPCNIPKLFLSILPNYIHGKEYLLYI